MLGLDVAPWRLDGARQAGRSGGAVARAVELGINYFDTAPSYGNGESEANLGRVLAALKHSVVVGTKARAAVLGLGACG